MSAQTVASWNSISHMGPDSWSTSQGILKRARDDLNNNGDDDDDDDDISIVSRTSSPEPMNVDTQDIDKYDEYARGVEKEVITVDTKIDSSNIGFSMLTKLGWVEGKPLGISGDGRVDPIPFYVKRDLTGLGKTSEDARMIESTVSQRRELDSERQQKETEEQRLARENVVARQATIQSELSETLKAFYCSVCDKQFTKVAQYDEHCNSYSHHHKIRFRDMQAAQRAKNNSQEAIDKRKEKERKREEKELRKVAKAAGVKIATAVPVAVPVTPATQAPTPVLPPDAASNEGPAGSQNSGWSSVIPEPSASNSTGGFRKSGWTTVDSLPADPLPPPPQPQASLPTLSSLPTDPPVLSASFSGFRSGGWTSLESTLSYSESQQRETVAPSAISSDPSPSQSSYGSQSMTPPADMDRSTLSVASSGDSHRAPSSLAMHPSAKFPNPTSQSPPVAAPRAEAARSGWQNFKRGGAGSRR